MELIKFTNKSTGQPLMVFKHLTWGPLRNPDGTTCLMSTGGAAVHVKESLEEVLDRLGQQDNKIERKNKNVSKCSNN